MVKIGLEIHGYLQTSQKLFCNCQAKREAEKPNIHICPICTAQPGSKPMLPNKEAIKKILQIALMLGCKTINKRILWQRKHYDWPDLPKGYQDTISGSYSIPNAENGLFEGIKIREIHLEEDPAAWSPETGCIDYNRSGLPLVEIVTEPNFKDSNEVINWIKQLLITLSYIKAVDKNAGVKVDVNISTHGDRVEIKNINSLLNIRQAIEHEIKRQEKLKTNEIKRETRRFDSKTLTTIPMRSKEQAADYRFIPDPDLPSINIEEDLIDNIKKNLPESPQTKLKNMIKKLKIPQKQATILTNNLELAEFFEEVSKKIPPAFALDWVTIELLRVLNYNKTTLDEVSINPEHFIELIKLVKDKKITELKAKRILNEFIPKSFSPLRGIEKHQVIESKSKIEEICRKVIKQHPKAVADLKAGKESALHFLIGQVMNLSERRANFKTAREVLLKLINQ